MDWISLIRSLQSACLHSYMHWPGEQSDLIYRCEQIVQGLAHGRMRINIISQNRVGNTCIHGKLEQVDYFIGFRARTDAPPRISPVFPSITAFIIPGCGFQDARLGNRRHLQPCRFYFIAGFAGFRFHLKPCVPQTSTEWLAELTAENRDRRLYIWPCHFEELRFVDFRFHIFVLVLWYKDTRYNLYIQ